MYVDLPESIRYNDLLPEPKSAGNPRPKKWLTRFDAKTKRRYRMDAYTGEIEWLEEEKKVIVEEPIVVKKAPPTVQWKIAFDGGKKYYYNEATGESQWTMPDEMKSKATLAKEAKERKKADKQARKDAGEQVSDDDSDGSYEYKKDGESDEEDQEAALELLKKQRIKEEEEREAERNREAAQAEIARQQAILQKRIDRNEERKKERDIAYETGISHSAGATATGGDVWNRNTYTDLLRLLHKQRLRQIRMREAEAHRLSGLTLLNAASQGKKPGISTQLIKGLQDLKGVQKLKFGKLKRLKHLALELEEDPDPRNDLALPYRFITHLSTSDNMKKMAISAHAMELISAELIDDGVIRSMNFFSGGMSSPGLTHLSKSLPTMTALLHLDLSGNAIGDEGALALSEAIRKGVSFTKLNMMGNRLELPGAQAVIESTIYTPQCPLIYVNLTQNFLRVHEKGILETVSGVYYDHHKGYKGPSQRYRKRLKFATPDLHKGRISKWPFEAYPYPHDEEYPGRGPVYPQPTTWIPLALRERAVMRERVVKQQVVDLPLQRAETELMMLEDQYVYSIDSESGYILMSQGMAGKELLLHVKAEKGSEDMVKEKILPASMGRYTDQNFKTQDGKNGVDDDDNKEKEKEKEIDNGSVYTDSVESETLTKKKVAFAGLNKEMPVIPTLIDPMSPPGKSAETIQGKDAFFNQYRELNIYF